MLKKSRSLFVATVLGFSILLNGFQGGFQGVIQGGIQIGFHAHAKDALTCSGENMISGLAETNPEIARIIDEKAKALPYGDSLLWKISKEGVKPSYVFGTMHLSDPRLLDLDPQTQAAFDESKTLALEITDILDPEALKAKASSLMKYSMYLDGTSISDRLTPEQEEAVSTALGKRMPIPWFLAKRLKPWALMGAMSMPACEQARKEAGKPFLDQALAQQADAANKTLVSLETMESQMQAMASLPEKTMVEALYQTTLMGDRVDDVFETMIQLYEQGKPAVIWAMMKHVTPDGLQPSEEKSDYADFQRVIVDKRNELMVEKAIPLIKEGGTFIAVGALHLPGERGILNILAQKGYEISRQ